MQIAAEGFFIIHTPTINLRFQTQSIMYQKNAFGDAKILKRNPGRENEERASFARIHLTHQVHRDLPIVTPTLRPGDHGMLAF